MCWRLKFSLFAGIICIGLVLCACDRPQTETRSPAPQTYLIRVGQSTCTQSDFNLALQMAKAAYPAGLQEDAEGMRDLKMRILKQLKEETIIRERAREVQIEVSEKEIDAAVTRIKADYTADQFRQIFLEQAISRHHWKQRLKMRLLMEKLLAEELGKTIAITPADIAKYAKECEKYNLLQPAEHTPSDDMNTKIIKYLRQKKTQALYQEWMSKLQQKYPIKINRQIWEAVSSS